MNKCKITKLIENKPKTLPIARIIPELNKIRNDFVKQANVLYVNARKYGFKNDDEFYLFLRNKHFDKNLKTFTEICEYIDDNHVFIKGYFKYHNNHTHGMYRWFYIFKALITKIINFGVNKWSNYLNKLPIPKHPKFKYDKTIRKAICGRYFEITDKNKWPDLNCTLPTSYFMKS